MNRSGFVAGHAPVHAVVLVLFAVDGPQEEERPGREQDVVGVQLDQVTVLEPLDDGGRFALGLAVERDGVVFGDDRVRGVFCDSRGAVLSCEGGGREKNKGLDWVAGKNSVKT